MARPRTSAAAVLALLCGVCVLSVEEGSRPATVLAVILARNKAHTLPHFLALFEALDYPKSRISLFVRTDHNVDETEAMLTKWLSRVGDAYHDVDFVTGVGGDDRFSDEVGPLDVSRMRYAHVMRLKEEGLSSARRRWADFVWFLDCDVFTTNDQTLKLMAAKRNMTVFAPLLTSNGEYSNFWAMMGEDFYYRRNDDYEPVLRRKRIGCFEVPLVLGSVFVNLRHKAADNLTFQPSKVENFERGPFDDMIAFAVSAAGSHVCNEEPIYGFVMLPMDDQDTLEEDKTNLVNLKTKIMAMARSTLPWLPDFPPSPFPEKDKLGVDQVYLVNLKRRPDRRAKMEACFDLLGIEAFAIPAVDGNVDIDDEYIRRHGIRMMPGYVDPFHDRPLKLGEIGCFMSHYNIWLDVIKNGHEKVIVLEDDINFGPYFRNNVDRLHKEIEGLSLDWDLIFLGRKINNKYDEPAVEGSNLLVHVNYTYWTLGYMLSLEGAKILVDEEPLGKILPVDEYLPIMYNKHPNRTWKFNFHNRILKAFSVNPLFLFPTHYVGEEEHFSDTEESALIDPPAPIAPPAPNRLKYEL